MTSRVLLEGILDVKDPRGSEDRKFWKAWRRRRVSFSVVHPPGRREPHLLLKLSHCSSEAPERQIRLQREGLRIFRCRSKSRPYRTWTIMSGNKLVLYFAAESEIQAQNWMEELRDGLWPSCFSFQMLTACSHEVSLIDDEKTFLSGLLGVYGRFVLTSEDVISLMHPHWGCTLLQISLSSVQDVLLVREAEIQPAGVFSILLKRDEESKVEALQFFCNRAMDAIQWILNKIYSKDEKSNERPKSNFPTESSTLVSDYIACFNRSTTESLGFQNTDSLNRNPSLSTEKCTDTYINMVHSNTDYENMQFLKINSILHSENCNTDNTLSTEECNVRSKQNNITGLEERVSWNPPKSIDSSIHVGPDNEDNRHLINKLSNSKLNEDRFYNSNYNDSDILISKDSSNKYYKRLTSNKYTDLKQNLAPANDISDSGIYSIVNKKNTLKDSSKAISEEKFSSNELSNIESVINNHLHEPKDSKLDNTVHSSKSDYREADCSAANTTNLISDYLPGDSKIESEIPAYSNVDFFSKANVSTVHSFYDSNFYASGVVKKQICSPSASKTTKKVQFSPNSISSDQFLKGENNQLFPNISSDILNTSCSNSTRYKVKTSSVGSSSDEDTETLPWEMDEFLNFDTGEGIYEDILDRRGTIYEEIDSSESDNDECAYQPPPSLPERPQKLEIPDSLRLQKLSKNIEQTLQISDIPLTPTKRYPRLAFIKKIKDVSRIMQISPTQESSREPFTVERKLPLHVTKNIFVLKPNVSNSQIKIDNVQNKCDAVSPSKTTT